MIDLFVTLGAVAESKALLGPDHGYKLPAQIVAQSGPPEPAAPQPWHLPSLRFDDSQQCLTLVEKRLEGFGTLRISHRCSEDAEQPVPLHSL